MSGTPQPLKLFIPQTHRIVSQLAEWGRRSRPGVAHASYFMIFLVINFILDKPFDRVLISQHNNISQWRERNALPLLTKGFYK